MNVLTDQALFDAAVAKLREDRYGAKEPELAVKEEPELEPEPEPEPMWEPEPEPEKCPDHIWGSTPSGSCDQDFRPECMMCQQFPREKWLLGQPTGSWADHELEDFLEKVGVPVRRDMGSWDLQQAVQGIIYMITTIAQLATVKKECP